MPSLRNLGVHNLATCNTYHVEVALLLSSHASWELVPGPNCRDVPCSGSWPGGSTVRQSASRYSTLFTLSLPQSLERSVAVEQCEPQGLVPLCWCDTGVLPRHCTSLLLPPDGPHISGCTMLRTIRGSNQLWAGAPRTWGTFTWRLQFNRRFF